MKKKAKKKVAAKSEPMAANREKSAKRQRGPGRRFKPGQSGNPNGRPKIPEELREAFRAMTPDAIKVLGGCLKAKSESIRINAAREILDRGWGKPTQTVEGNVHFTHEQWLEMLKD